MINAWIFILFASVFSFVTGAAAETKNTSLAPDCAREYAEQKPFSTNKLWKTNDSEYPQIIIAHRALDIRLFDQNKAIVSGLILGYVIADPIRFESTIRSEENAKLRLTTFYDSTLRISLGNFNISTIDRYDFTPAFLFPIKFHRDKIYASHVNRVRELGLELVLIDSRNATYRLGECNAA